jgi:hypothetical protein
MAALTKAATGKGPALKPAKIEDALADINEALFQFRRFPNIMNATFDEDLRGLEMGVAIFSASLARVAATKKRKGPKADAFLAKRTQRADAKFQPMMPIMLAPQRELSEIQQRDWSADAVAHLRDFGVASARSNAEIQGLAAYFKKEAGAAHKRAETRVKHAERITMSQYLSAMAAQMKAEVAQLVELYGEFAEQRTVSE